MNAEELAAAQNSDGGWPYLTGPSWTEPTAYAVLALPQSAAFDRARQLGFQWLKRARNGDGGLRPHLSVRESTWVTCFSLFLPQEVIGPEGQTAAARWLLYQAGRESALWYRLLARIAGTQLPGGRGWPWFSGTSGWTTPTSLALLALTKYSRTHPSSRLHERLAEGRKYLLGSRCVDGGWNYGAPRAVGIDAPSYPETTGLALLALTGTAGPAPDRSVQAARRHLAHCQSSEAESWLSMALRVRTGGFRPRDLREAALRLIAEDFLGGKNVFA